MIKLTHCPCQSGNQYEVCCRPFHEGMLPDTAVKLMRSRYAAYALCLSDYLMHTTHPASPRFCDDKAKWIQRISEFSSHTDFKNLEILGFQDGSPFATVTFFAHLFQNKKDVSFTERSYFEKVKGKWLYLKGQLSKGREPNLVLTSQLQILPLAYYGSPILRKVAEPIQHITNDIRKLVDEMIETMDAHNGIGLAAPQVHHSIRLFIIRKPKSNEIKVFINPKITLPSVETWKETEDCLSIPTLSADVERPQEITIEYADLAGHLVKEKVSGWEARIIMHENDHINGVLFLDHLDEKTRGNFEPLLQNLQSRTQILRLQC